MSRKSIYTDELAAAICERIANGESLRAICRDDDMPNNATVMRWLMFDDVPVFREQYARAREAQADALADMMLDVALVSSSESAQSDRVKVDVYKWRAGKLKPKVYGDKLGIGQADGLDPVQLGVAVEFIKP